MSKTGRTLATVALMATTVAGCQSPGPLLSRQSTVGTLKTTVSQLEFQNEQLSKQVAELKTENRRFENRLVQEEAENSDLASRLDDVVNVRGGTRTGSRSTPDRLDDPAEDSSSKVRRSNSSTKRRPPAAAIPGRIEPSGEPEAGDVGYAYPIRRPAVVARRSRDERWLPVAEGLGSGKTTVK